MIHVDFIDRPRDHRHGCRSSACTATIPPAPQVCPADAIKKGEDGVVQSSLKPRCIACSNCVLACPFGVPKMFAGVEQMMKCDMCYDRTSVGKRPMCATVCPSQALAYVTPEQIAADRREQPVNTFQFGNQKITTKVFMMAPAGSESIGRRRRRLHVGGGSMTPWFRSDREPLWREEFSVYQADERYVTRRQFTKFLVLTSLGMFAGNSVDPGRGRWFHRAPAGRRRCQSARARRAPGGRRRSCSTTRSRGDAVHPGARRPTDEYVAYSQKCTHLSCAVYYDARAATGWSAPATRATSRCGTAACCRDRRRGRCRASCWSGAATSWWRGASRPGRGPDMSPPIPPRPPFRLPSGARPGERRGLTAIDGALALIAVLLVVQMWLLTAALEAYLAGHAEGALPAALASGLLLAGAVALYRFVRRIDARQRRSSSTGSDDR